LEGGKVTAFPGVNYSSFASKFTHLDPLAEEYSASKYPVNVPLFYLQGEYDGATPKEGAVKHFQQVAKSKAQLLVFKESSHMPTGTYLWKNGDPVILGEVFKKALSAQEINCEEVKKLNSYEFGKSALTSKGFTSNCN
jgi:fermentation-respiration switch protein FrsA (DUF1100 family)